MLKRLALILSLVAAFGIGGSTLMASSASAANCSQIQFTSNPNIWYNGYWVFGVTAAGCDGLNGFEFGGSDTVAGSGIYDVTRGANHFSWTTSWTINSGYTGYTYTYQTSVWGSGCGAPHFYVKPFFSYRIRNSVGSTWGPWHSAQQVSSTEIC